MLNSRFMLILGVLLALVACEVTYASQLSYGNSYALLIGINKYPNLSPQTQRQYAVNDVRDLKELLVGSYGFPAANVKVLTDRRATRKAITNALSSLANPKRIKSDDRILIYFSGDDLNNTALGMQSIWDTIAPSPAKHVLVIADSCLSGVTMPSIESNQKSRQLITAGSNGQPNIQRPEWGHGAFTHKLLNELKARTSNIDKPFTATNLFASLLRSVSSATGGKQTPGFYINDSKDEFQFTPTAKTVYVEPTDPVSLVTIDRTEIDQMVLVPAGEFWMGSWLGDGPDKEKPMHSVYLDAYYIGKYEVTVGQYRKFCTETGRQMPKAPVWGWKEDHAVVNVTWEDANAYAKWAGYRLPTEAEWEKAARGTDARIYPWGEILEDSKYADGSTRPVGSYPDGASAYGCQDMGGNVWEWCSDWFDKDYFKNSPSTNPTGPATGTARVLRGGSWNNGYAYDSSQCSKRYSYNPALCDIYYGFRIARTP